MYVCMHVCSVNETRQSKATIPKEELPQAGFEPVMFCILGRCSTN